MSTRRSNARREDQHQLRLAYLRRSADLCARVPDTRQLSVTAAEDAALHQLLRGMRLEKLFSVNAATDHALWTIRVLVTELRAEPT